MVSKVYVSCNTEKTIDNMYNEYRECKQCNFQRSLKRYYKKKDKLSNQRGFFYEKKEVLLLKSELYQQNRKYEGKISKKQTEEVNKKSEDLTQAVEVLKTPKS